MKTILRQTKFACSGFERLESRQLLSAASFVPPKRKPKPKLSRSSRVMKSPVMSARRSVAAKRMDAKRRRSSRLCFATQMKVLAITFRIMAARLYKSPPNLAEDAVGSLRDVWGIDVASTVDVVR